MPSNRAASFVRLSAVFASYLATTQATIDVDMTCGLGTPNYSVQLGGAAMFGAPPRSLFVRANGTWQSDFVLMHSQPLVGQDALGTFNGTSCTYALSAAPNAAVVVVTAVFYSSLSVAPSASAVRFTTSFPAGLSDTAYAPVQGASAATIALFPAFTAPIPAGQPSNALTWQNTFLRASHSFSDGLGVDGGPVVLYGDDVSGPAVLLSPLDRFLACSIGSQVGPDAVCNATLGGAGCWAAGVSSTFTALPPGFDHSWLLLSDAGITPLMASYRAALTGWYASTSTAHVQDVSLTGLTYQTDNGAQLCFGCTGPLDACLLDEAAYLRQIGAPVQLFTFENQPLVTRNSSAMWCVSEFQPDPVKVPMGIQAFREALGVPLQMYLPYLCSSSMYPQNFSMLRSNMSLPLCGGYDFYDPAPADSRRYFDFIMTLLLDYGGTLFEVDFLKQNRQCVNEYIQTIGAADAYLAGMTDAALARGIAIQFCMATPYIALWTLTAPAVTNTRVSIDFMFGTSWQTGESSLLAWAANLAPSKDTLWSTDNGNQSTSRGGCPPGGCPADHTSEAMVLHTILAALSTGPVGYSDAPGETDITLVMRVCDASGNLLQPSRPIVALDSTHDVTPGGAPTGFALGSHTDVPGMSYPAMHFLLSHHLTAPFTVRDLDLWPRLRPGQLYAVGNWTALQGCANGSALASCSVSLLTAPSNISSAFAVMDPVIRPFEPLLLLVAPMCGELALFGEIDKVAAISIQRFTSITCQAPGVITLTAAGQPSETGRIAYVTQASVQFLSWTFPASQPAAVACTISNTAAECS